MCVAAEITEGMFRAAKRSLRIDNPLFAKGLLYELREDLRPPQRFQRSVKADFSLSKRVFESLRELTSKHLGKDVDRKKEVLLRRDPVRVIRRESAGRHHAMDMWVVLELLIPTMQHTEEAYLCAQMFRIACDLEQCLSAEPKE